MKVGGRTQGMWLPLQKRGMEGVMDVSHLHEQLRFWIETSDTLSPNMIKVSFFNRS
jgi:hypothetical protein